MKRGRARSRKEEDRKVADLLHELGQLKRVQRSGWWLCGVKQAESVAEHTFRTAAIAYVLGELEGADSARAAAIALFHDLAEARVNDAHRLARRYASSWRRVERAAERDQLAGLPAALRSDLSGLLAEARSPRSLEARIAKDADRLECLIQAREYEAQGVPAREWIESSLRDLQTRTAKRIAGAVLRTKPSSWRAGTQPASPRRRGRASR